MSAAAPSPDPLFLRLSAGDPSALDEVCRRYGPRVASIVRRRMGKRLRARLETADLAQETMAAVVQAVSGTAFRTEADFLRWVGALAQRRVLHAARHWRARRRCFTGEVPCGAGDSVPDRRAERPSQVLLRSETLERVQEELGRLPPPEREVIVLRLILGLSWSAVGAALQVTEECAQMRFTRARRQLALALG